MSFRFFLLTIAPPLLGVGLGYLLGGRLAGLGSLRIRALWLVRPAAAVQFAQYSLGGVRHFVEDVVGVSMLALVFTIVLGRPAINLPRRPAAIRVADHAIVLGAALNGVVIAANGRMPYDPAAVAKVASGPARRPPRTSRPGPAPGSPGSATPSRSRGCARWPAPATS